MPRCGSSLTAETAVTALSAELGARVTLERERRDALEAARAAAAAAHLRDARLASDLDALERDRRRLLDERGAAEAEMASGRRALAASVPPRDLDLEADLAEAERALAHALAELGALRSARQAHGEELAALSRAAAARQAEAETARRRLTEVENRAAQEAHQARTATERRASLETMPRVRSDEPRCDRGGRAGRRGAPREDPPAGECRGCRARGCARSRGSPEPVLRSINSASTQCADVGWYS